MYPVSSHSRCVIAYQVSHYLQARYLIMYFVHSMCIAYHYLQVHFYWYILHIRCVFAYHYLQANYWIDVFFTSDVYCISLFASTLYDVLFASDVNCKSLRASPLFDCLLGLQYEQLTFFLAKKSRLSRGRGLIKLCCHPCHSPRQFSYCYCLGSTYSIRLLRPHSNHVTATVVSINSIYCLLGAPRLRSSKG